MPDGEELPPEHVPRARKQDNESVDTKRHSQRNCRKRQKCRDKRQGSPESLAGEKSPSRKNAKHATNHGQRFYEGIDEMKVRHHGKRVGHSGKQGAEHNRGRIGKGDEPDGDDEPENSIYDPADSQVRICRFVFWVRGPSVLMARLLSDDPVLNCLPTGLS